MVNCARWRSCRAVRVTQYQNVAKLIEEKKTYSPLTINPEQVKPKHTRTASGSNMDLKKKKSTQTLNQIINGQQPDSTYPPTKLRINTLQSEKSGVFNRARARWEEEKGEEFLVVSFGTMLNSLSVVGELRTYSIS